MMFHSPAAAWTASGLTTLSVGGDYFRNYDFQSESDTSTNVDWPVTMLFWENAEVDKVKDAYEDDGWDYPFISTMKAKLNDGDGWVWDGDMGVKTWGLTQCHMRVYADSDDRMYNDSWGYYVLATTHYDKEFQSPNQFGWSEDAEGEACDTADDQNEWSVSEDWANFYNAESSRWDGNYYIQCDGYASSVYVP